MTIEDPVEYNLRGIAQIGVSPKIKLDFREPIKAYLETGPDIIMVGEIRDAGDRRNCYSGFIDRPPCS